LRELGHDVRQAMVELPDETAPHELARIVAIQRELGRAVRAAVSDGELPIIVAGNCSTAVGTLAARPADVAVVWFDAHADFNTAETTRSGMVDGMAVSMVTGRALRGLTSSVDGFTPVDEGRVILVGARDLDPPEEAALATSSVVCIRRDDAATTIAAALRRLGPRVPPVYAHLDLDVLDPAEARANQYAAPDGLSARVLCEALHEIARVAPLYAVAITAYDPRWDGTGAVSRAAIRAVTSLIPPGQTSE